MKNAKNNILCVVLLLIGIAASVPSIKSYQARQKSKSEGIKQLYLKDCWIQLNSTTLIGVNNVIRGNEAYQTLQNESSSNPKPAFGNELVILTIKIKKFSDQMESPSNFQFDLYYQESETTTEKANKVMFRLKNEFGVLAESKFKRIDVLNNYKSNEVREGTYCFEVPIDRPLAFFELDGVQSWMVYKKVILPLNKSGKL
jgi:hypothetical protein